MAESNLRKYTTEERLNKMDVDIVDITVSIDAANTGAYASGDLLFPVTEIPYAVAVKGGAAILQSASIIITGSADGSETGALDVVITSDSTALGIADNVALNTNDSTSAVMDGIAGTFSITNAIDMGVVSVGSKQNIGMVCKAASSTTSLYCFGIARSTNDYEEGSAVLRLGFIKD
jgi:hypothetical protein